MIIRIRYENTFNCYQSIENYFVMCYIVENQSMNPKYA